MAAKEMYDYLSTIAADVDVTLNIQPHDVMVEDGVKNVKIRVFDDESETRHIRSTVSSFFVNMRFNYLTEADAGTLFDLYHDSNKGCGMGKSFKWVNHGEPSASQHTYVVRFASPLPRSIRPAGHYEMTNIKLKVLGRIAD